ncbi:MAG TPA: ZIP family metal transporter, partial [Gemmatimonadaceae bacterium]|nr:ZIP family metal transporter [Gemmatimonadaceae bacterium]
FSGSSCPSAISADPAVGLTTTIAVVLHEVPQELGDYGVLLFSGLSVRRAVQYNIGSAVVAFLGAAVVVAAGPSLGDATTVLLPVTAGSFLYIAASDLLPELQRGRSPAVTWQQLITILLGVGVMLLPSLGGA